MTLNDAFEETQDLMESPYCTRCLVPEAECRCGDIYYPWDDGAEDPGPPYYEPENEADAYQDEREPW